MPEPLSLYLHIPFCRHRCAYCDFNTYAGQESSISNYVKAICREISIIGGGASNRIVGTIFFGGGTPSLLTVRQFQEIFESIQANFDVIPGSEISLEANPGTVSSEYLFELHALGFNRISYGVQSSNPQELRMLERIHSFSDVIESFKWSRMAGFDNLNLDLIYSLPEQSLQQWQQTVKLVIGLKPEHISAYALTLEPKTPFGRWAAKGLLPIPDDDLAATQYEWLMEYLELQGFEQYEISNWSQKEKQCQHNLQYWHNLEYLGIGAGAHGYTDSCRYSNVLRIKSYIDKLSLENKIDYSFPMSPAVVSHHWNSSKEDMMETMLTGLRLTQEGVSSIIFQARFGFPIKEIFGKEIDVLLQQGLLEWAGEKLRLTLRGRLLGNQVFIHFV